MEQQKKDEEELEMDIQATYNPEENRPNVMPAARTFEEEVLLNTESFEK